MRQVAQRKPRKSTRKIVAVLAMFELAGVANFLKADVPGDGEVDGEFQIPDSAVSTSQATDPTKLRGRRPAVYLPANAAEILRLVKSGLGDDVILAYIQKSPSDYLVTPPRNLMRGPVFEQPGFPFLPGAPLLANQPFLPRAPISASFPNLPAAPTLPAAPILFARPSLSSLPTSPILRFGGGPPTTIGGGALHR